MVKRDARDPLEIDAESEVASTISAAVEVLLVSPSAVVVLVSDVDS